MRESPCSWFLGLECQITSVAELGTRARQVGHTIDNAAIAPIAGLFVLGRCLFQFDRPGLCVLFGSALGRLIAS